MDKEKALKNQGSEFREGIYFGGGGKNDCFLSCIAVIWMNKNKYKKLVTDFDTKEQSV